MYFHRFGGSIQASRQGRAAAQFIVCSGVWGWLQQAASRRVATHALLASLQSGYLFALLASIAYRQSEIIFSATGFAYLICVSLINIVPPALGFAHIPG